MGRFFGWVFGGFSQEAKSVFLEALLAEATRELKDEIRDQWSAPEERRLGNQVVDLMARRLLDRVK